MHGVNSHGFYRDFVLRDLSFDGVVTFLALHRGWIV